MLIRSIKRYLIRPWMVNWLPIFAWLFFTDSLLEFLLKTEKISQLIAQTQNYAITQMVDTAILQKVDSTNRLPPWTSAILNIFRGWMPLISTLARNIAAALQWLRQNHRQNQEVCHNLWRNTHHAPLTTPQSAKYFVNFAVVFHRIARGGCNSWTDS